MNKPIGEKQHWLVLANENAQQALAAHLSDKLAFYKQLECLQTALRLDNLPQRLECFDISHTQGEATVASCVVFDAQGPRKMDYRRFNIEDITPGDDYAAMRQALLRRYKHLKNEEKNLPDVLLIDGGKGQLKQAEHVLEELQISGVLIIGVAKGPGRKSGLESLYLSSRSQAITLPADSLALRAILTIRDEAHRFAITGHRGRRAKKDELQHWKIFPVSARNDGANYYVSLVGYKPYKMPVLTNLARYPVSVKFSQTDLFSFKSLN